MKKARNEKTEVEPVLVVETSKPCFRSRQPNLQGIALKHEEQIDKMQLLSEKKYFAKFLRRKLNGF